MPPAASPFSEQPTEVPRARRRVNYFCRHSSHPDRLRIAAAVGLLFGFVFCGFGTFVLLAPPMNFPPPSTWDGWATRYLFGYFVAGFGGLALVLSAASVIKLLRYRTPNRTLPLWLQDHNWNAEGAYDDTLQSASGFLFLGVAGTVFLIPFHVFAMDDSGTQALAYFVLGLLDLATVACLGYGFYFVFRRLKYGRSRVRFERFPYFTGEELLLRWTPGQPLSSFSHVRVILCCYEQRVVRDENGTSEQTFELYRDEINIAQSGINTGSDLPIRLQLPARPLGTRLSARSPRFWELEIHAQTPGIDYGASFLIPIYERPSLQSMHVAHMP